MLKSLAKNAAAREKEKDERLEREMRESRETERERGNKLGECFLRIQNIYLSLLNVAQRFIR